MSGISQHYGSWAWWKQRLFGPGRWPFHLEPCPDMELFYGLTDCIATIVMLRARANEGVTA